jgi:hypothetical protein
VIRRRPNSVRVRLTFWYVGVMVVVLCVYAALVYAFVSDNSTRLLDERLHEDFDWAADMLAQRPDDTIAPYDETGEGDSPWLQVYSLEGELLYETPEAQRNPVLNSDIIAAKAEERIVTASGAQPTPFRVMAGGARIGGSRIADRSSCVRRRRLCACASGARAGGSHGGAGAVNQRRASQRSLAYRQS